MTIAQNLAFPLEARGVARDVIAAKTADALQMVRLDDLHDRYPDQLSGGQQQRVALARAIVADPPLLLMDEPLGALDKNLREEMQFEIKRIQQSLRVTVLYVTHDQDEALTMSDRIVVMSEGRIEQAGPPEEIYERPRTRFVAEFVGDTNQIEGRLDGTEGARRFLSVDGAVTMTAPAGRPAPSGPWCGRRRSRSPGRTRRRPPLLTPPAPGPVAGSWRPSISAR
jgi:ABC-type Fe3+/spermidine/putrescine transport system ATPase subunit